MFIFQSFRDAGKVVATALNKKLNIAKAHRFDLFESIANLHSSRDPFNSL